MKKHDAFETDLSVHQDRCTEVNKQGDKLIDEGNHNADNIAMRMKGLADKLQSLQDTANRRKARLIDNSAFVQFIWKTDVVESWIGE